MTISSSVGRGGSNRVVDAFYVQGLLNEAQAPGAASRLLLDGLVGPKTMGAILTFQAQHALTQDGRIDPTGPTLALLEGDDPDQRFRPLARAIVLVCNDALERLNRIGVPLNRPYLMRVKTEIASYRDALAAYFPQSVSQGRASYALLGLPSNPVFPMVQVAAVVVMLQALIILIGAMILILLLQALAPSVGPIASKLAAELEKRKAVLQKSFTEAMVQFIIYVNEVRTIVERCKPQGNLNNAQECHHAIQNVLRILRNIELKLDALKFLVNKMWNNKVSDLTDFRNARQLVNELMEHYGQMQRAIQEVITKCKCHFLVG